MNNYEAQIAAAKEKFEAVLRSQLERNERITSDKEDTDFSKLDKIVIGICGGDGIGPIITDSAKKVLEYILADEIAKGKIVFNVIDGLTIENRVAHMQAIPDDVMAELKKCNVILKGPTTTPKKGDPWPNIESANVAMRKALDLYANVRPVRVPEEGIDWTFFRENTEGSYAVGSQGVAVTDELSVDFCVTTTEGSERIAKAAFEYARKNKKGKVSIITKANIIKATDGKFLDICQKVAKNYPEIETDDWFIDITTAKLIDPKRRTSFKVFVLPNLYGGVGTAGSANIGHRYAMFEAIHGSAPRMISEGRGMYADPCSMLRATVMLLSHIGYQEKADALEKALDICMFTEKKLVITGRDTGATCDQFSEYVMQTLEKVK